MKKKIIFLSVCLIILMSHMQVSAAEHVVDKGQVFGKVAEMVGYFGRDNMHNLAVFNGVSTDEYSIKEGQVILFLSEEDVVRAQEWIEEQLQVISPKSEDYADLQKALVDIKRKDFEYNESKDISNKTFASEILVFSDAQERRQES